jgi:NTE family protein
MRGTSERRSPERPKASVAIGDEQAFSSQVKTINLALQGGGAHGAFTWGVLDRLVEEKDLAFEGLSATSAGAMNAAVFAYGLAIGGREGARKALATIGSASAMRPSWGRCSQVPSTKCWGITSWPGRLFSPSWGS